LAGLKGVVTSPPWDFGDAKSSATPFSPWGRGRTEVAAFSPCRAEVIALFPLRMLVAGLEGLHHCHAASPSLPYEAPAQYFP